MLMGWPLLLRMGRGTMRQLFASTVHPPRCRWRSKPGRPSCLRDRCVHRRPPAGAAREEGHFLHLATGLEAHLPRSVRRDDRVEVGGGGWDRGAVVGRSLARKAGVLRVHDSAGAVVIGVMRNFRQFNTEAPKPAWRRSFRSPARTTRRRRRPPPSSARRADLCALHPRGLRLPDDMAIH